ncbi:MAG TPA: hypothetical protein VMZ74_03340 [Ramlibacter sp.]|nr:hypothetical protein [Ramlibacter sp.]
MRNFEFALLAALFALVGCATSGDSLQHGFLPGADYTYYAPLNPVDLQKRRFRLVVTDARGARSISCSDIPLPRNTELEGVKGLTFFTGYLRRMIELNNGIVDDTSTNVVNVKLKGLSGDHIGFLILQVWGLVEFEVTRDSKVNAYCSAMADGHPGAPLSEMSVDTRTGAFRKMVSGSTRQALESLMADLAKQ